MEQLTQLDTLNLSAWGNGYATNPNDGNDEQSMHAETHKQFTGNNDTKVVVAVSTMVESLALSCGIKKIQTTSSLKKNV